MDAIRRHGLEERFGEVLVPTETVVEVRDGQKRTTTRKVFAGYIFVQMAVDNETLHVVKAAMESSGYGGTGDRAALIEAVEAMTDMAEGYDHPQGAKRFNGKTHQVFGHQYITRVEEGRLNLVHTTSIEDTLYPDEVDYTSQPL